MSARGRDIGRGERVPEQALAVRDDEVAVIDGAERDKGTSRSMAAPASRSTISASPSSSITAATSSLSGLVVASLRRSTAAPADGSPC